MAQRNLTLTEELERIEQSITLTLQEIDHNFSKAHRIVTGSIIPVVEQYAQHSDKVWDGSRFWKQFFEASANVSLSSYEEPPEEDDLTAVGRGEGQDAYGTPGQDPVEADDTVTTTEERPTSRSGFDNENDGPSILDSPSVTVATRGTPARNQPQRQASSRSKRDRPSAADSETSFAEYPSPYEALKAELKPSTSQPTAQPRTAPPTTPGAQTRTLDFTESSPIPMPPSTTQHTASRKQPNADRLLHNVLDKNYRLQATPHAGRASPQKRSPSKRSPQKGSAPNTNQTTKTSRFQNPALDSSPFSPAPAAPQLRSEIFGSPVRRHGAGTGARGEAGPRTPGVSVQQRPRFIGGGGRTPRPQQPPSQAQTPGLFSPSPGGAKGKAHQQHTQQEDDIWYSSDDDPDAGVMSPPKTMQFHVPASRLLQTPAREASKRIVEDLMRSAGVPDSTVESEDIHDRIEGLELDEETRQRWEEEDELVDYEEQASPSVVRAGRREDDDAF